MKAAPAPATATAVALPVSSPPVLEKIGLVELRAMLPAPLPPTQGLPTGVDELDAVLAFGGLPRGRLSEVIGATGKLTFLRVVVQAALGRRELVAYIDASRTLSPRDWAHLNQDDGLWIVRPRDAARAAWCADVLLRSAAFSLVVLDSAPPVSRAVAVRLGGLARESNAAFVVVGSSGRARPGGAGLGGTLRLRVHRRRQRLRITVEKGARVAENGRPQQSVEVSCADGVARRLCSHPEVPDRRGVAGTSASKGRGSRGGKSGRRAATPVFDGQGGMLRYC